jgi:threonine dehydrogenase-like Zn-dependent dehydrogenase
MRALVITGPGSARVQEVEVPVPGAGQAVVDVRRAGICGTDAELLTGQLAYFAQGKTGFPVRPGHEWCGVVSALGAGVDPGWLGARVTGDTMLGCGRCPRCAAGHAHVCADRREVGIMGWPGALAEKVLVRASSLYRLPGSIDDRAGALVEPGGNGWRAASAAQAGPGKRILVCGPGRSAPGRARRSTLTRAPRSAGRDCINSGDRSSELIPDHVGGPGAEVRHAPSHTLHGPAERPACGGG